MRERVRSAGRKEACLSSPSTEEFAEVPGFFYEDLWADQDGAYWGACTYGRAERLEEGTKGEERVGDRPSPLLKHNETESNTLQSSSSDVPVSVATCHRRAPSRCNLMSCLRAKVAISRISDCGKIVPLSVFSREMTRVGALYS